MTGTRTHSDVDYYDQLGVARNAKTEEIRHAYRALVRLLHPDHQTDPELKDAAERQLRKLNRIHAILIDTAKRQAYDEYLADEWAPPILDDEPNIRLRKNLIRGVWAGVGVLTVVLVFWLGSESSPGTENPPENPAFVPPSAIRKVVPNQAPENDATLREELNRALAERDDALREIARLRQSRKGLLPRLLSSDSTPSSKPPQAPHPSIPMVTELPSPFSEEKPSMSSTGAQKAAGAQKTDVQASRKLTGFWFYVRPREGQQNKNKSLYPPEFIELTVREENGNINGKYRARYKILDRPIAPEVNFDFTGRDTNGNCSCIWRGIGGAHGQINLQLSGDHIMRFDWIATELGSQQGLSSGTATLTRRSE